MTNYKSGLAWLGLTLLLPLTLMGALLLGEPQKDQVFRLVSGVFSYGWLLSNVYLSAQSAGRDQESKGLAQVALLCGSLPLGMSHSAIGQGISASLLVGRLALALLVMGVSYSLLFWVMERLGTYRLPRVLSTVLRWLNLLATALVFIHVQLIDKISHNLPFMVALYLVTVPAFVLCLRAMARAKQSHIVSLKGNE